MPNDKVVVNLWNDDDNRTEDENVLEVANIGDYAA